MTIKYKGIVEGLLFASGDEGITMNQIAKVIDVSPETVKHLIEELTFDYEHINRGMTIIQSNEIYHLTTKPEHNEYYKKLLQHPRTTRMSQATLETLAIIAYEQPITRVEIEEIRGVNSDYAVQTLLARSLIENVGRKESIGRPILFGTSKEFLTYFGLSSIDELPPLPNEIDKESVEKEADLFFRQLTDETDEA
ncbi:SMC-Scp complex subunit ScpB [Pseudogracilibacillus auburnensis]|uniref:Segregation and condensation protein B n=1 Tax=Pseudogracilibacillus auburnensis TaxID=1494959 RepID=A0A2V3W6E4_9BACI|nr:SMC-Scp complex subunit ScpB [Pseudogracilibacillus auburnensis]PXW88708.1 segregation and condensation protein B [Pseudogracilibacillus auburnensis]